MGKTNILIADAESVTRKLLSGWLESEGYTVVTASDAEQALEKLKNNRFDILVADINLKKNNIGEILNHIRENDPDTAAVIAIGYDSMPEPLDIIKNSDADYLIKPLEPYQLKMKIRKIIRNQGLERENLFLKEIYKEQSRSGNIIGCSEPIRKRFELIQDIAMMDSTVLIKGERGTGKKSAAIDIHVRSRRAEGPFVTVNFNAIPHNLMEKKLFGCQKGESEEAAENEKGLLELARGGTLFLDEVGDASDRIQTDLLTVLKNRFFYRIRGKQPIEADFRIIASTCKDLETEIMKQKFREDFYLRLNAISFEMPLLRECKEDIPVFAEHFVRRFAQEMSRPVPRITGEAMDVLIHYPWPENRRELANAVERAVMVSSGGKIVPEDLPVCVPEAKGSSVKEIEKDHILQILEENRWNIARSAKLLEVDRSTLYNKLKRYGLHKK